MEILLIAKCDKCGRKVVADGSRDPFSQVNLVFEGAKVLFRHSVEEGRRSIWICADCQASWEALMSQQKQAIAEFYSEEGV